jgi:hypothetical protein
VAVVGEASIVVRAITTGFKDDVKRGLAGIDGLGDGAGNDLGSSFSKGFSKGFGSNAAKLLDVGPILANAEAARTSFASLQRQSFALAAGITAVGGVIGSLVGGIGLLITIVGAAAPVLVGFINIFGALGASALVLKTVFSGLGAAIEEKTKAGTAAVDNSDAIADADLRLKDAEYALLQVTKQQATELANLIERRNDAANAVVDANIASEKAERGYQNSVKNTQDALEDVTKAREDAKEAIQQLRFELEGGVISEKKARLEFEKARESLQRVQDLPPNSRARREAELAFAEADLNLRRAIDKTGDLRKKTNTANKEGIDGSAKVVSAEEKLKKAKEDQIDAEIGAAKAVRSVVESKKELQKIDEELASGSERELRNLRELELAQRAVDQATRDLAKAKKGLDSTGAPSEYAKLGPETKAFVDYVVDLKEKLAALKTLLQEAFFDKFTDAAKLLTDTYLPALTPLLEDLATALGTVAENFAKAFTKPERVDDIKTIFDGFDVLALNYGAALTSIAEGFTILAAEFTPFAIEFSAYVKDLAASTLESIENARETGAMQTAFETATGVMYSLFASIGNLLGGIGNTIKATFSEGGGGWYFLDWLEQVTEKWEQFTKKSDADGTLDKYMLGLSVNFTKVLTTIGLIIKGMLDIAASKGFGEFMDSINKSVTIFNEIGLDIANGALPSVGRFIESMAKLIKIFTDAESIAIFFETLRIPIDAIVLLLDNELGRAIVGGLGAVAAFGLAIGLLSTIFSFLSSVALGVISSMITLFTVIFPGAVGASATLTGALSALAAGELAAAAPLLIIIAAIVALVAIFKLAYDNSEIVREAVRALGEALKNILGNALEDIKESFKELIGDGSGLKDFFVGFGEVLTGVIVPAIAFVVGRLVGFATGTIERVIFGLAALRDFFMIVFNVLKIIVGVFIGIFTGKWGTALDGLRDGLTSFQSFFTNIFRALLAPVRGLINGIIDAWNGLAGNFSIKIPKWVPGIGGSEYKLPTIPRIPNFAMGGVVYPTAEGTLARVAEAGRAERIEPLDPSGLSKRDRAMINMLAGPAGGINITVNPSAGMDERELANLVSRQLAFQLRKGAA